MSGVSQGQVYSRSHEGIPETAPGDFPAGQGRFGEIFAMAGTLSEHLSRLGTTRYIDPTKQAFAALRENNCAGPIHMLNLVRLRAQASYPDGRQATGAEAYAAYGRDSVPVFTRLGGRIV